MTPTAFAKTVTRSFESVAVEYIDSKANRLYFAKYSTGEYGRLMLPLIKKFAPNINLNGQSTNIALAITNELKAKGYDYHVENGSVSFRKDQ